MKHEDIAASRLELPVQPISQDVLAEKYLKKEEKTEDQLFARKVFLKSRATGQSLEHLFSSSLRIAAA